LGLQLDARIESKFDKTQNDRCIASQFFNIAAQCRSSFQPGFDFQAGVRAGGTVADRVHVNVDYDSKRSSTRRTASRSTTRASRPTGSAADVGNVSLDVPVFPLHHGGHPAGELRHPGAGEVRRPPRARDRRAASRATSRAIASSPSARGRQQRQERDIADYEVEARRFFFTVDPRAFAGYPNIDILSGFQMRQLAGVAARLRAPVRVSSAVIFRSLGAQPPNPNGRGSASSATRSRAAAGLRAAAGERRLLRGPSHCGSRSRSRSTSTTSASSSRTPCG